jgi:hypothetical protein
MRLCTFSVCFLLALNACSGPYTIARLGTFVPQGDISDLDEGVAGSVTFGNKVLPFLSVEGTVGYADADGQFGASQLDLRMVPLFVDARANVPIVFMDLFGGVGVGGVYADYEASGLFSDSDFVAAAEAFVGVGFGVGRLSVGAEARYLVTDETDAGFAIEGVQGMLFVSLPF